MLLLAAASLAASGGGCSGPEVRIGGDAAAEVEGGGVPADFAVAVTVLSPGLEGQPGPARYVMEADWVLRAVLGPGAHEGVFPARTRPLSRPQVEHLWGRIAPTALADPASPYRIGAWEPDPLGGDLEPVDHPVYLVFIAADGDRRLLAIDTAPDGAAAEDIAAARTVAETLAGLAWVK